MTHYDTCQAQIEELQNSLKNRYDFSNVEVVVDGKPVLFNMRLFREHLSQQIEYYNRVKEHMQHAISQL